MLAYVIIAWANRTGTEFIYHAQASHPSGSSGLEDTDNIFRLNVNVGFTGEIIRRLQWMH